MKARLVGFLVATGSLLVSPASAAEADSPQAADEWRGRRVLAASPQVRLREQPNEQAPAIAVSAAGIWLDVKRSEGDWLEADWGWLRTADAVRDEAAIEYFTAELARDESAFAYIARSRAWLKQNDIDKAQADVSEALRLEPENARAHFARSKIAAAQQRTEDELAACDRTLEIDPRDPFALRARSRLKTAAGEHDRAISDLDRAIESLPNHSDLWSARGYCWRLKGDDDKALADFTDAIQLDPRDAYSLAQRAAIYLRRQELDKALQNAELALKADAKMSWAFAIRGTVRAQRGELDAALGDLDEAIRLDATDPFAFRIRGNIHSLQGQYDSAVTGYTQAISLDANDAETYQRRAEVWMRKNDAASAIIDLTQYVRLRPKDAGALAQRGWLNKDADIDAAFKDFNAALAINPRHVYALLGRSQVWNRKNDLARAIDDVTAAIDLAPNNPDAYVLRGWLRKETDLDAALKDLDAALEINARHVGALLGRAEIWQKKDEPGKALADLDTAIDVDPNNSQAYWRRAELYSSRGEHQLAIDDLTAALQIKPDDASCLMRRASEWSFSGNLQRALADCQAVLAKEPKNLMAYCLMAQAHSTAGQLDEALEDYAAALRIDPHDEGIRFLRAYELFNQDKLDLALADLDEVIRNGKRVADAYNWRAYFWMQRKNWDKALADFNEAVRLEPDDAEHYRMRADCWYGMKEFDKAIEDADRALRLAPALEAAAQVRRQALEAKQDPSKAVDARDAAVAYGNYGSSEATEAARLAGSYELELRGPDGLKLAHESRYSEEFGPPFLSLPVRLPMLDEFMARFKFLGVAGDADTVLYARLQSKRLSAEDIAILHTANPSMTLTKADFEAALAGKDVTKILVLRRREGEPAANAEWEVTSSAELDAKADPVAEASRRVVVAATLLISKSPPPLVPSLPDERMIAVRLRGPEGLMLAHESMKRGEFDRVPHPIPAHFALVAGAAMRFKLSGPPVAAKEPLYGLLTLPPAQPASADLFVKTVFSVTLSSVDLDAALAGKRVTRVVYQAYDMDDAGASRLQSLSSAELEPGADPIAEASKRGMILAVVLLSQQIADLPLEGFKPAPDADSAVEPPAAEVCPPREKVGR